MKYAALAAALLLAGCGTLPEPFYGNSGPVSAKLSIPPPPVLVIPTPENALLPNEAARNYASNLATALVNADIPSIARAASKTDWHITITANITGPNVTPHYVITGPDGKVYGAIDGTAVAAPDWANGSSTVLANATTADAATLAALLAGINADIQQSNPNSLENRPARLYLTGVAGAPGDGDNALALNLNRDLSKLGLAQASTAAQADFTITGKVKAEPDKDNQILIELDWRIYDSNDRNIGQVTQLHDVNLGDITPYWGDVAAAAADQAATGIQEAVRNATLRKPAAAPAIPAPALTPNPATPPVTPPDKTSPPAVQPPVPAASAKPSPAPEVLNSQPSITAPAASPASLGDNTILR